MIKTKLNLGPDEFKVIREISLARPSIKKNRKILQIVCVIGAFIMGIDTLTSFLDHSIGNALISLACLIAFIWCAKVGLYYEQDLIFKIIQNKFLDNLKMEQLSIYLIQMELQQYLNLSMLQVNINGTHFKGGVCLKIIFIYKPLLKNSIGEKKQFNSRRL